MSLVGGSRLWGLVMCFCAIWSAGDGMETRMVDLNHRPFVASSLILPKENFPGQICFYGKLPGVFLAGK